MKLNPILLLCLILNFTVFSQTGNELPFQKWALTPPMGWNSWDCFGPSVVEDEVKANADYMAIHLKDFGWEYVVVDIRWYIDNQTTGYYNAFNNSDFIFDQYGRYLPSPTRFPSSANGQGFKPLADYVHNLGLKFGIHIMRGVPKKAVQQNLPILGSNKRASDIYSTAFECTWLQDNWTVDANKAGAQEYYNSIMDLYASWGVDYIKVDDLSRPYHAAEIELIRNAIDQTGRPMILSMSPGATPLDQHDHAKNNANLWRIFDDFWDNWSQLNYAFNECADWAPYISPGAWPDADMLPLGHIAIRGERGADRQTNFTHDEQYTLMTLWSIFKSPLMFGGHLPDNDEFTNSLLTNNEVLNMHKYAINSGEWYNEDSRIAWVADDPTNADKYVALFNVGGQGVLDTSNALYRSGVISTLTDGYGATIDVQIPKGSKSLFLIVGDTGDGISYDHANWINPTIYLDNGTQIPLTNLDWEYATTGYQSVNINQSVTGNPLTINNTTYTNGIGTHSQSVILYEIPDNTIRFTAFSGLDQAGVNEAIQAGTRPTVEFMISTQDPTSREVNTNNAIVNSGRISRTMQREGVSLVADITDAEKLYLVVTDAGDNFNYDHADWINPTIYKPNGDSLLLTSLPWVSATSGWESVQVNTSLDGNPLRVNGNVYANGFGVNSYSIIEFNLPEGYTSFESFCGFDDEVNSAPNGVSVEFMVFTQDPTALEGMPIPIDLESLGFDQSCNIRDLWNQTDLGAFSGQEFAPIINSHGAGLYRISPNDRIDQSSVTISGPSSLQPGETATLNINVSTGSATQSGWVMLYQNGNHIATLGVDNSGNMSFDTVLAHGVYEFNVSYSGNNIYAPATSSTITLNVGTLTVPVQKKKEYTYTNQMESIKLVD